MEEKQIHDDLAAIRNLMERSQKFISLSGLSGILAGIYALIGAALAYIILYNDAPPFNDTDPSVINKNVERGVFLGRDISFLTLELFFIALAVLLLSIITGIILTRNKAKRKNQPMWGNISRTLLFYMAVPLVSGGIFIFILLLHGHYGVVSAASLIFYGLSLVSASNFTFSLVKYLGICEIVLGLIAACVPGYGLLFWAIGFGVLHIIYGSMMYLRYDR